MMNMVRKVMARTKPGQKETERMETNSISLGAFKHPDPT